MNFTAFLNIRYIVVMKICLLLFLFFIRPPVYSQNPEGENVSGKRESWMVGQRMYPGSQIPSDAVTNAIDQRDRLRHQQGYFLQHKNNRGASGVNPMWSSIGPTPGSYGGYSISGRCNFVKYDPNNPSTIYLGAACGGLWKSFDNGNTWMPLTDTLKSLASGAIAIDDVNNILYYGTGEFNYFTYCYYGYGIYKSNDGGLSFHLTQGLPTPCYVGAIAIKPDEHNVVLAAVGSNYTNIQWKSGLFRSTDYGETWTRIVPASNTLGLVCCDVAFSPDGSKAYITGPANFNSISPWDNGVGYQISYDGGRTFVPSNNKLTPISKSRVSVCNANNGNRIYVISSVYDSSCSGYPNDYKIWEYLYRSDDAGESFTPVWKYLVCSCPHDPDFTCTLENYQPWYNLFVKCSPSVPDIVYWGTTSIWKSTDGGRTSSFIGGYGTTIHPDFHDLDFVPGNNSKVIAVSDGGVYSSNDAGNSWANLNLNLTVTQFYSVSSDPGNPENVFGGTQDNALQRKLPNYSHEWVSDRNIEGEIGTVTFDPINPSYVLAQVANTGGLYYSTNNGNSFDYATTLSNIAWILPIAWHPTDPNIVYTAGFLPNSTRQILDISRDGGKTWNPLISDLPTSQDIEQLAISNSNPSVLFASVGSFPFWPWAWSYQTIYKSINGGVNWTDLYVMQDNNPKIPKRYISKIGVNPQNENDIFITLSGFGAGHVWRSIDGGKVWKDYSGNLPDVPVNDIVVFNDRVTGAPICIVATDCGVFITMDLNNRIWWEVAPGLPNSIAMKLDYRQNSLLLRVATHGRGIWEVNLAAVGPRGINTDKMNKRYFLYQNYPNPFNPSTKIKFEIPVDESVSLKLFDVTGKEVGELINGFKKAGTYSIPWDASRYSSGVYFYKLEAGDFITVKRMVLVK